MASRIFYSRKNTRNNRAFENRLRKFATYIVAIYILGNVASHADVYRFIDQNGVVCFTDTPTKKGAVRIIKERRESGQKALTRKTMHPSLFPIAGKSSPNHVTIPGNGTLTAFVLPVQGTITSSVGMRHDPIDGLLRHHNGIDIAVPEGTPVKPVAPGVVTFSGFRNGYGNTVIIAHDDGMVTLYAHNSSCFVIEGERVAAGSTIALSGSTGRCTGPHLHFEAWKNGVNMTMTFIGDLHGNESGVSGPYRREEVIRRTIQADGSLLFTNLP